MEKKAIRVLKYLLVALFVSYYCESTFFLHTHNFGWGTVTHSHPYMPTGEGHSHTSTECHTISFLTNLLFTVVGTVFIAVTLHVTVVIYAPRLQLLARHLLDSCSLRAPPVSIC